MEPTMENSVVVFVLVHAGLVVVVLKQHSALLFFNEAPQ